MLHLHTSTACSVRCFRCCFPRPLISSTAVLRMAGSCKCPSIALCHQDLFLSGTPSLPSDCCPFHFVLIAPKANLIRVCSLIKTRWIQIAPCELERSQSFQEIIIITFFVCMCADEHCQYMYAECLSALEANWENFQPRMTNRHFCSNPFYLFRSQISLPFFCQNSE